MNNSYEAKTKTNILITGCSKGFGLIFTEKLALQGHKVYAGARDLAAASHLMKLCEKYKNIEPLKLDVCNDEHIETAVKKIQLEDGALGVLINNAGYGLMGPFADLEPSNLKKQFETNLFGNIELTRKMLPLLIPCGLVINLSSVASFLGLPCFGAYSASKVALNTLSMSLAVENAEHNLSVAVIEPGPYSTGFRDSVKHVGETEAYQKARSKLFKTQQNPEEVALLVSKLVEKKLNNKLGPYTEIPIGKNTNLFRILSRWLPQELLVKLMIEGSRRG